MLAEGTPYKTRTAWFSFQQYLNGKNKEMFVSTSGIHLHDRITVHQKICLPRWIVTQWKGPYRWILLGLKSWICLPINALNNNLIHIFICIKRILGLEDLGSK